MEMERRYSMKVDNVITLSSGVNYLLLEQLDYQKEKYFFCVRVDETKKKPIHDYVFVKENKNKDKVFVTFVEESGLLQTLYTMLTTKYSEES